MKRGMFYDWSTDLYPIRSLPEWARNRVIGWLRKRYIPTFMAPDLANAAAEAYYQCVDTWKKGRAPFEAYAGVSMDRRMAQRLDELQIGQQTSRNAEVPNFDYVTPPGEFFAIQYPTRIEELLSSDVRNERAKLTDEAYKALKEAARQFQRTQKTPSQQQDGYLSAMNFRNAMTALKEDNPLAHDAVYWNVVWDKTLSETVKRLGVRRGLVYKSLEYGKLFIAIRLEFEHEDSSKAALAQHWDTGDGLKPAWEGLNLVFPIPIYEEDFEEPKAREAFRLLGEAGS